MRTVPRNPNEPQKPDFSDLQAVQQRLVESSEALAAMTPSVAVARQCKEFSGDLRKRALCVPMREFLVAGESAAAAETKARASEIYGEQLGQLKNAYGEAERVILTYEAEMVRWKSAQSLLSSMKALSQI